MNARWVSKISNRVSKRHPDTPLWLKAWHRSINSSELNGISGICALILSLTGCRSAREPIPPRAHWLEQSRLHGCLFHCRSDQIVMFASTSYCPGWSYVNRKSIKKLNRIVKIWYYKSDKKIRKNFFFIYNFQRNISWTVNMNMHMIELMMSLPHNFPCILFTEMTKIPYFSYEKVKLAFFISTLNKCRIMLLWLCNMGTCFYMIEQKINKNFNILYTKYMYMENCEEITSSTHSFAYIIFISTANCHIFLIFIKFTSNFHCSVQNVLLFLLTSLTM